MISSTDLGSAEPSPLNISKNSQNINNESLSASIASAAQALIRQQNSDGHWCFELEADCTIPAEYILMLHFMDELDSHLEAKIANYLRNKQNNDGSWPLYHGGRGDISCSVKSYYALKLSGVDINEPVMQKAKTWILAQGGAARANVFTRLLLAMFQQVPWRAAPYLPVEIMLLPRWFPFHLSKVAYWSRTVMVPLLILYSLKATAKNPCQIGIPELFTQPAEQERHYFQTKSVLGWMLLRLERLARVTLPACLPKKWQQKALATAEAWMLERLNGEDGLGGIFPAMVNAYEALTLLGYQPDHPVRATAKHAIKRLLVIRPTEAYCQPCLSPVWDTALSALALQAADPARYREPIAKATDWIKNKQILTGLADWQANNPGVLPGGWAFFYNNPYYPDLDDTAVAGWLLHTTDPLGCQIRIQRAADWLASMQSKNGGFAAYDKDNTYHYLNEIPFADHKALLDPPSSDVAARCLIFFALLQRPQDDRLLQRCLDYLRQQQESDGSWFGRWGTNYIYGTWSVMVALTTAGIDKIDPAIQQAVTWFKSRQQADGGWGESNDSYENKAWYQQPSTSYQTAWALLALMAAGEVSSEAVQRGIAYLMRSQREHGVWEEPWFPAPGFPRIFYLKYYGYSQFFPLWALARYRALLASR